MAPRPPSLQPIRIGAWHSVKISRIKNRGMLQVDDGEIVRGESKGTLSELNLGRPLYIGGVPEFLPLKYSLVVQIGLDGAIQRIIVNDEIWDDILSFSTGQRNIEHFTGPPCVPDICKNNGRCIPILEDYRCQCVDGYSGKWCNKSEEIMEMNDNVFNQPVKFDGSNFMQFSDGTRGMKLKKTRENYITITFRTNQEHGLMLWMNKGPNMRGDYIAIAIVRGYITLSFNLGKETVPLISKSHFKVNDNNWHTVTVKSTSEPGATELNTDGILWIGGSTAVPSGFPEAYYHGFRGCISSITIDSESLNLSRGYSEYCQPS
ncbi:UNVERIFIED_CONTAM: Agrin [Trichonephila clavipes]